MSTQTKESGVVHFRVAEDAGVLVMTIAQEHLIYDLDVDKALKTLTDCLMGCPMDLALKILVGDYVINTDVDEQQFYVGERDEISNIVFPKIEVFDWCRKKSIEIAKTGDDLKRAIDEKVWKMKYRTVHVNYTYEQIFAFIGGDNDEILEDLKENSEVLQLSLLIKVTKDYIDKSIKLRKVIDWLEKTYPEKFKKLDMRMSELHDSSFLLTTVIQKFQSMLKAEWDNFSMSKMDTSVEDYIVAAVEIEEIIEKGIEPVNIMDNYSAGWLSPDGLYYALNGEIANMLHNQIADALQDKGIVPNDVNESGRKVNPDQWLEEHGWVKIHGSNVQFDGCNNFERGKRNVDITDVQLKKIYEYCSMCHNGIVKVGWRLEPLSATRFRDMYEMNSEAVNKKYFEY
jgi:hypothetical protein